MDKIGYIKLHRKSWDNFLYNENRPATRREAWEDILVMVNFSDSDVLISGKVYKCKRGQSLMSLDSWGRIFRWDKSKVRRFFNLLLSESMIELENLQKTTRLTVCNYDSYQGEQNANETHLKRKRNASETQMTPIEEYKEEQEEKEEKNIYTFDQFWNDYDKKVGGKETIKKKFDSLKSLDKLAIKEYIPKYKSAQPDKQYRKNPDTFLNQKAWNDEIIPAFHFNKNDENKRECYFTSNFSRQGEEIKGTYSRYLMEVKNFGSENVTFLRYAD